MVAEVVELLVRAADRAVVGEAGAAGDDAGGADRAVVGEWGTGGDGVGAGDNGAGGGHGQMLEIAVESLGLVAERAVAQRDVECVEIVGKSSAQTICNRVLPCGLPARAISPVDDCDLCSPF